MVMIDRIMQRLIALHELLLVRCGHPGFGACLVAGLTLQVEASAQCLLVRVVAADHDAVLLLPTGHQCSYRS
jgi:hypothetical protein